MGILGLIAAILTTFSFLPQAIRIIKTKDTSAISIITYSMFVVGTFLWMIYGILNRDLPVAGANVISFLFSLLILILKLKYK